MGKPGIFSLNYLISLVERASILRIDFDPFFSPKKHIFHFSSLKALNFLPQIYFDGQIFYISLVVFKDIFTRYNDSPSLMNVKNSCSVKHK